MIILSSLHCDKNLKKNVLQKKKKKKNGKIFYEQKIGKFN